MKIGGGESRIFQSEEECLQFMIINQESSFMWSGHLQLQITANCYQVNVQVLSVNSRGEGSIQKQPFVPDARLKKSALLPEFRKDGGKVDVPQVWLLYTNGNHFDTLTKKDDPIITRGPIQDSPVWHLKNENDMPTLKDGDKKVESNNISATKNYDKNTLIIKLRNSENAKKQLEINYREAEITIKHLQEENTTLKIQVKDLGEFIILDAAEKEDPQKNTNESIKSYDGDDEEGPWITVQPRKKKPSFVCKDCKFPCQDKTKLKSHMSKHGNEKLVKKSLQSCSLCSTENTMYKSDQYLKDHIQRVHSPNSEAWNCRKCDFQGFNEKTLGKHQSYQHNANNRDSPLFACDQCPERFSSKWNLTNHKNEKTYM